MTEKKFYRPDELAVELGVTAQTIRRWIRDHRILHVHDPKGLRISREECQYILDHGVRLRGSCKHELN
jgi:excisionase family DNA binding protein